MIHDIPEDGTDGRVHILDETCWCKPEITGTFTPSGGGQPEPVLVHNNPPLDRSGLTIIAGEVML